MKIPKILIVSLLIPLVGAAYVYFAHPKLAMDLYRKYIAKSKTSKFSSNRESGKKDVGRPASVNGNSTEKVEKEEKKEKKRNLEELLYREELLLKEVNRMAHRYDEELITFLITRFDKISERSQGAFLERIGRYDKKKVNQFLIKQAKENSNLKVRRRAISALSRKANLDREKALKELYLKRKSLDPETIVIIIGAYYRILSDTKLLSSLEKELLSSIEQAMSSNDESFLYKSLMELSKIDPENKKMFKMCLVYLKQKGSFDSPEFTNFLIKLLARYRPKEIEKDFMTYFKSGDVKMQIELLNSLSLICPKEIWSLSEDILNFSQNGRVHLAFLRNMIFFPLEESIPFLEKNKQQIKVDHSKWDNFILSIKDSDLGNTCQDVKLDKKRN